MSHDDHSTDNKPNLPNHLACRVERGNDNVALRSREALECMREEREQKQELEQTPDMNPAQ